MKQKLSFLSIFTLLFLYNACFTFADPGVSNNEILLGISNAQSGPAQFLGQEYLKGFKAYFNEINATGGVNGKKIKIIAKDDGYEPNKAIDNTT